MCWSCGFMKRGVTWFSICTGRDCCVPIASKLSKQSSLSYILIERRERVGMLRSCSGRRIHIPALGVVDEVSIRELKVRECEGHILQGSRAC